MVHQPPNTAATPRVPPLPFRLRRRDFLKVTGGTAALAAFGGVDRAAADPGHTLAYYDLTYVYDFDRSDPKQAAIAYDHMHFVSTLQGVVNRFRPQLYVSFTISDELDEWWADNVPTMPPFDRPLNRDDYWLRRLREPGEWLSGIRVERVPSLDALLRRFRRYLRGAVVWDPRVPSTSNVASTVGGVEDTVAIRYDPEDGSVFSRFVAGDGGAAGIRLPVKVWLVNRDGSSLFTGRGSIPGTTVPSTGSAKCDAYWWAKVRYLDTGLCNPRELASYLDSYWLHHPFTPAEADGSAYGTQQALLTNHDYMVSRRGFVFDLSPWDDEAPVDDPNQPIGTDRRTLEALLRSAYERTNGGMFAVHGFTPWVWKYSNFGEAGGSHEPFESEWRLVQLVSAYNGFLDADAEHLDAMANASVYQHHPLETGYVQNPKPSAADLVARGFVGADGSVRPRRYLMFYIGDYDSAAWLYHIFPIFWDDSNRGAVPLNWAFNPNLADRMAPALDRAWRTRTSNDYFITGDSGAGYLNPGMLQEPREFSRLPSGLDAWAKHCGPRYNRWDITVTGFIIDGFAPALDDEGLQTYARFSPDGFAAQQIAPLGLVATTPYTRMGIDLGGWASPEEGAAAVQSALEGDSSAAPPAPEFHVMRTVLATPTWHKEVTEHVQRNLPEAAVEFVDAYTFYALIRQYLLEQAGGDRGDVVPPSAAAGVRTR